MRRLKGDDRVNDLVLELFGGPGGWAVAADRLGMRRHVAIEWDRAACQTRAAAGHRTIQADISRFPVEQLIALAIAGLIASPECTFFSAAGTRAGVRMLEELAALIVDMFAGRPTRAGHRRAMAAVLRAAQWPPARMRPSKHNRDCKVPVHLTRGQRSAAIRKAVMSASLVAEPARFIHACEPEWVALEQVPAVLPLWEVYAACLRERGYSVWCGKLNAADYGVPQTRERAILIASRVHAVRRPEPTHYDPRKGMQLWGTPWVGMADALGWGATDRAAPTVTAGGTATGGAEPFGHRDRDALIQEQASGRWLLRTSCGQNELSNRPQWVHSRPATTVQGDPRIGRPGHKNFVAGGESQFARDSVRITVAEAAELQSFPADYPWQGTTGKQFEQVGNAFPPLLAEHVLAMATGLQVSEVAA
jgi:DNA (cytosine-5)-methyltransferase 1